MAAAVATTGILPTAAMAGILPTAVMAGIFAKWCYRRHFRQWKCSQTRPPDRIALRRNFRFRSRRSAGCSRRSSRRCCCCCLTRGRRSPPLQPQWPPAGCPTTCSYIWPDKINNNNNNRHLWKMDWLAMQLLHGFCCFNFFLNIPLPPATLALTACPVYLISTVSGCKKAKYTLGRCCASSGHITKLEQSILFRYQW